MNRQLYDYYVIERTHRSARKRWDTDIAAEYASRGMDIEERMADRFCRIIGECAFVV